VAVVVAQEVELLVLVVLVAVVRVLLVQQLELLALQIQEAVRVERVNTQLVQQAALAS
jgi:hypothetical protein